MRKEIKRKLGDIENHILKVEYLMRAPERWNKKMQGRK